MTPIQLEDTVLEVSADVFTRPQAQRLISYLTDASHVDALSESDARGLVEELFAAEIETLGGDYVGEMSAQMHRIALLRSDLTSLGEEAVAHFATGGTVSDLPRYLLPAAFAERYAALAEALDSLKPPQASIDAVAEPFFSPEEIRQAAHEIIAAAPAPEITVGAPTSPVEGIGVRLRERHLTELQAELDDIPPGKIQERFAARLAGLSDRELDGAEQVWRGGGGAVDESAALETVMHWGPKTQREFLELLAEVGPRCEEGGLEGVLHSIFDRTVGEPGAEIRGVTGSYGQLYAARTAIREFGATRLEFEVNEPRSVGSQTRRVVDIKAYTPKGWISIEVKTNLLTAGAVDAGEVGWDIVEHAAGRYQNLRYLYNERVDATARARLGERMLRLFDEPAVRDGLRSRGQDVETARTAFREWLDLGGLGSYSTED